MSSGEQSFHNLYEFSFLFFFTYFLQREEKKLQLEELFRWQLEMEENKGI
jgi:hypothetical protein